MLWVGACVCACILHNRQALRQQAMSGRRPQHTHPLSGPVLCCTTGLQEFFFQEYVASPSTHKFHSYLSDRYQSTSVNNSSSSPSQLMYGVPQGSVLGPILFILYTTPLSNIIANHSVNHQLFTDDTQLQKSAPLNEVTNLTKELNACTDNIKTWMTENQLKLSNDKTEALLFPFWSSSKTFYRSPLWLDYSWLSQHPLLWFCQEPWIHSWLKTVHEEAHHKNLPNCLFRA